MKLTGTNGNNFIYPKLWANYSLLLLLVGMSVKSFGQLYISDNSVVTVKEGTLMHMADQTDVLPQSGKAKIYVGQNTRITNFPSDASVEIVYLKKENRPKKSKEIAQHKKKINKPLQPPMVKKDTNPEKKSVLSFTSRGKAPASSLFYAGSTSTIAFINTGNFSIKTFSQPKAHYNFIYIFFLNDAQPINTAFTDVYLQHQIHLENQITRPPPCHSVRV